MNYWQKHTEILYQHDEKFLGRACNGREQLGYDWLPKWDRLYDVMTQAELMLEGKINGYIVQGFNPLAAFPDKNKSSRALSKLKYMVVIDPLVTESSNFWQHHGEMNDVNPADIQTEIFRLPSSCLPKKTVRLPTPGAGYSGTGRRRSHQAKRCMTARSSGVCLCACVSFISRKGGKPGTADEHQLEL